MRFSSSFCVIFIIIKYSCIGHRKRKNVNKILPKFLSTFSSFFSFNLKC
jgi:hypothetical protein